MTPTQPTTDLATGDRVNHYTTRMPNGTGTVVEAGPAVSTVKWDRTGLTRSVPNRRLVKVVR